MTDPRADDPTDFAGPGKSGDETTVPSGRQRGKEPLAAPLEASAPVSASHAVGAGGPTIIESDGAPVDVESSSTRTVLVEPSHDGEGPSHRRTGPADASPPVAGAATVGPTVADPVLPLAESAPVSAGSHVAEADAPTQVYDAAKPPRVLQSDGPATREAPTAATAPPAHADAIDSAPSHAEPTQTAPAHPVAPATQTVYVQQPVAPKKKGNRGFGVLMSILATIVFALVWAGVAAAIIALSTSADRFFGSMSTFAVSAAFITPIAVFLVVMVLLALLVNRGGWAWYIIGGFLVAVLVYAGYLAGGLITVASRITQSEVQGFLTSVAITPLAIAAGVAAREVALWTGLAISARGKRVKAKNAETRAAFDREEAARTAS